MNDPSEENVAANSSVVQHIKEYRRIKRDIQKMWVIQMYTTDNFMLSRRKHAKTLFTSFKESKMQTVAACIVAKRND